MSEPKIRFRKVDGSDYANWKTVQLRDIAKRVTRKNSNNETDRPLTIASIEGLVDQRTYFGKTVASKDMSGYFLLKNGEYAYNKSYSVGYDYGSIKRLNAYDQGALSTLYICFALNEDENSDYIQSYFNSLRWYDQMPGICAEGARNHGLLNVPPESFFSINITMPSDKEEQEKIACFLEIVENRINSSKKELDKWKELKKGMLQKMFPKEGESVPEIRFPGFEGPWVKCKLGDIADVTKLAGFEFTEHVVYSEEGNIIALRGLNIKSGQLVLDDVKYIDGSNFSKLNRSKLYADDIMFTYVGTVGEVAIIKENDRFYLAPNVSRIRVKSDDSPKFISQYMRTDSFYGHVIFPLIATSSQPALSMENIRKFEMRLPPKREEQDKLSECFDSIDTFIAIQQHECDKWQSLKKAQLQQMFV